MKFQINSTGNVILADQAFMDAVHPNDYTELPEPTPEPTPEPVLPKHISVGSFFDRFGAQKYPILASTDVMVRALIQDCSVRSYIDLDNAQLPYGLDMLIAAGYAIDKEAILTTPVSSDETPG